jgi:hypothetical protein
VGNAALPVLGSLRGEDEGIEGFKAELGTWFGRWWCGGDRARPWQSSRWRLLIGEDSEGGGRVRESENIDRDSVFHSLRHARATSWLHTRAWAATRHSPSDTGRPQSSLKISNSVTKTLRKPTDRGSLTP